MINATSKSFEIPSFEMSLLATLFARLCNYLVIRHWNISNGVFGSEHQDRCGRKAQSISVPSNLRRSLSVRRSVVTLFSTIHPRHQGHQFRTISEQIIVKSDSPRGHIVGNGLDKWESSINLYSSRPFYARFK